jgi:hypothetical protein
MFKASSLAAPIAPAACILGPQISEAPGSSHLGGTTRRITTTSRGSAMSDLGQGSTRDTPSIAMNGRSCPFGTFTSPALTY